MENRRSPVMAHLPVGAYLRLTGTANNVPDGRAAAASAQQAVIHLLSSSRGTR